MHAPLPMPTRQRCAWSPNDRPEAMRHLAPWTMPHANPVWKGSRIQMVEGGVFMDVIGCSRSASVEEGTIWPFNPGTGSFSRRMGPAGVHPCAVPRGCDSLGGNAVSWPGVAMGQAVPQGECLRGGEQGHGSATAAKAKPCGAQSARHFASARARRPPWHDSLEGFPTVSIPGRRSIPPNRKVGSDRRCDGLKHPFERMGFPERVNPSLPRTLPVVVARGVQRDVGVRQIMSQICRCPRNGLRHQAQAVCG